MHLTSSILTRGYPICLAAAATLLITSATASAHTWHVDGDNVSGTEDGSAEHPYILISSAMDQAAYGDTVLVMPGEYSESINIWMYSPSGMNCAAAVVPDGVVLTSASGADSTTIHGVGTAAGVFFDCCGPETELRGFTIICDGTGWGLRAAVIGYASEPRISAITVTAGWPALYFKESCNASVIGNKLLDVTFVSDSGGVVVGNDIAGTVYASTGSSVMVMGNSFPASRERWDYALYILPGTGSVEIADNDITGRSVGAYVCRGVLRDNRFSGNAINVEIPSECTECSDIDAEMNWWGTMIESEIAALLVDGNDSPGVDCVVDYTPWCLDSECTQSLVHSVTWGELKALFRDTDAPTRR